MRRFFVAASVVALIATAVHAQNLDVIKQRRQAMQDIGAASYAAWKMFKGDAAFELATVQNSLATMEAKFSTFKDLFPDNSKDGGTTDAKPAIWSDKAGFNAANDAALAAIKSAAQTIKDIDTFKAAYKGVADRCSDCHKSEGGYTIRLGESFKKPKP